jgi:hypothetical protein
VRKKQRGKANPFAGKIPVPDKPDTTIKIEELQTISVSLKYYHPKSQCLSQWKRDELKKLSSFFIKLQALSLAQIRGHEGLGFCNHQGAPASGFSRPRSLSPDVQLCEMRVDNKARVHGFQEGTTFFLIWLDRGHEVFPSRK